MASLYKKTRTVVDPTSGRKRKVKSGKWWGKYRDTLTRQVKRVPLYGDKQASETKLRELVKRADRAAVGDLDPFEEHRRRSLHDHLKDYDAYLRAKNRDPAHIALTIGRIQTVLDGCKFVRFADVSPSGVLGFLADLRVPADEERRPLSASTSNGYLTAIKAFLNWMKKDRRAPDNPISHLSKLSTETDTRRGRRPLTAEEIARLVEAARIGRPIQTIPGPDRAMLYMLAVWTGLRRGELASLTRRSFNLGVEPTVSVAAAYSKRRRQDVIPLHAEVARLVEGWLADKRDLPADEPLLPVAHRQTAKMIRKDLEAARRSWLEAARDPAEREAREKSDFLTYQDEDGLYADFHAARHTFVSNLARAGVSPKVTQELARHSDIRLTMDVYTHLELRDLRTGIECLAPPPSIAALRQEGIVPPDACDETPQHQPAAFESRGAPSGALPLAFGCADAVLNCISDQQGEHLQNAEIPGRNAEFPEDFEGVANGARTRDLQIHNLAF